MRKRPNDHIYGQFKPKKSKISSKLTDWIKSVSWEYSLVEEYFKKFYKGNF